MNCSDGRSMNKAYAAYKKACRDISIFNVVNYEDMTTSDLNKLKRKLTKCKEKRQIFLDRCIYGIPMSILNDPEFPTWEYTLQQIEGFINENGEKAFLEKSDTMRSLNIKENPEWDLLAQGDEKMSPNTAHELPIYHLLLRLNEVDGRLDYLDSIGEFEKIDAEEEEEEEEEEEPEVDIDILAEWNRETDEINSILSERAEQQMQDELIRQDWARYREGLEYYKSQINDDEQEINPNNFFQGITAIIQQYNHDPSIFDKLRNFDKETYELILDFINFRNDFDKQKLTEKLIQSIHTITDEQQLIFVHLLIVRMISEYSENMISFNFWKKCPGHEKKKKSRRTKITQGQCSICRDKMGRNIINYYIVSFGDYEKINDLDVAGNFKILYIMNMEFIKGKFLIHEKESFAKVLQKDPINELKNYHSQRLRNDISGKIVYSQVERDYVINLRNNYIGKANYLMELNDTNEMENLFHTAIFTDEALAWYGLKFIDRQRGLISQIDI